MPNSSADGILKITLGQQSTLPYFIVWTLLLSFYLHRFRLQVLLSMDTQSRYRRALKPVQEREVAEDWRRPRNERDRARRAAETLKQRSEKAKGEVVLGRVLKLLLHSGKVPMNVEQTRNRSSAIRHFQKEAMKMWRNNFQFLYRTATHIFLHPYLSFHCLRKTGFNDTERTSCNKKAPDLSKPLLPTYAGYYSITH